MERKKLFSKMSSPSSEHDFRTLSPVTGIPARVMWPEIWLCAGAGALLAAAAPSSSENPGHVLLLSWSFLVAFLNLLDRYKS